MGFLGRQKHPDLPLMHFSLFRRPTGKAFEATDVARLTRLRSHIERAAHLAFRLRASTMNGEMLQAALNTRPDAMIIVDTSGMFLQANARGEQLLRESAALGVRHGRLVAKTPKASADLAAALAAGDNHVGAEFWLDQGRSLACHTLPLALPNGRRGVVLMVSADRSDPNQARRLMSLFDLTFAEADVAAALAHGQTVSDIAKQRRVSITTVRTQIREILAKTDCRNQAQLVSRIAATSA
jgi:DNA-binding CsgD family transcriptional regulator